MSIIPHSESENHQHSLGASHLLDFWDSPTSSYPELLIPEYVEYYRITRTSPDIPGWIVVNWGIWKHFLPEMDDIFLILVTKGADSNIQIAAIIENLPTAKRWPVIICTSSLN